MSRSTVAELSEQQSTARASALQLARAIHQGEVDKGMHGGKVAATVLETADKFRKFLEGEDEGGKKVS